MNELTDRPPASGARLDSWKEIAAHLGRDVRTVQRWEKNEGLPVHRHLHDKQGSVYAFPDELDAWREGRRAGPAPGASEPAEAPVEEPAPAEPRPRSRRRWVWALGLGAVLAAAVGGVWRILPGRAPVGGEASLVVLPFQNLSGDAGQDYFTDGITEELITQLGRTGGDRTRVVALGSALAYRRSPKPPRQIAAELGVAYVLDGTVRRSGDRVRVAVHLVRGRDQSRLWDESYDSPVGDILSLQSEVAGAIAASLQARIGPGAARRARGTRPEALEAHLKGRFFWNKRTPGDLLRALEWFRQAEALDPGYAPAQAGLADCYALLGSAEMGAMAPNDAMPKARRAAERALALDPGLAEAHASLAHIQLIYDWDLAGAERSFRRALLLNPACAIAHQWFSLYYNVLGRTDEALAEVAAAERLDPLSPTVKTARSETCYFARRFPEAEAAARAALELDPGFLLGWVNLGRALEQQGRFEEAAAGLEKAWAASGKAPGLTMLLGHVYARKGDLARARAMLRELQAPPVHQGSPLYVPAIYLAAVHSGLGERPAALANLRKALAERCEYLVYLPRDPMADGLRGDPEFAALLPVRTGR